MKKSPAVKLKQLIEERMSERNLSNAQVAANAGDLSESALSKLRNSDKPNPQLSTFISIARGLGLQPDVMMARIVGADPDSAVMQAEYELARRCSALPKRHRRTLETLLGILEAEAMHGNAVNNDNGGK